MIGGKAMPVENSSLIGQGWVNQKCEFCVCRKCKLVAVDMIIVLSVTGNFVP